MRRASMWWNGRVEGGSGRLGENSDVWRVHLLTRAPSPTLVQSTAAQRLGTATVRERTRAARVSKRIPGEPQGAGGDTA